MKAKAPISRSEFLNTKADYSPLLVHLTRAKSGLSANQVLDAILTERMLRACDHHCIFDKNLQRCGDETLRQQFKVVCFTETPLDQIEVLLQPLEGRWYQPEPYGLVFKKEIIRQRGGNPVFYATKNVATPLWELYWKLKKDEFPQGLRENVCSTLALVTLCDDTSDWHWEREWRIVGDLRFGLEEVYCGICPESEIVYYSRKYRPVKFIDPYWRRNRIFDELVKREPEDIPFG